MPVLSSHRRARNRGQALIGLLVVSVLLIALYLMFLGPRQGADGQKRPSVARQSIDEGKGVALQSNISQIQQVINMYKNDNEGKAPASLEELRRYAKDFPAEMWVNPIDGKPLVYDPATGIISAQPSANPASANPAGAPIPGAPNVTLPVVPAAP